LKDKFESENQLLNQKPKIIASS